MVRRAPFDSKRYNFLLLIDILAFWRNIKAILNIERENCQQSKAFLKILPKYKRSHGNSCSAKKAQRISRSASNLLNKSKVTATVQFRPFLSFYPSPYKSSSSSHLVSSDKEQSVGNLFY